MGMDCGIEFVKNGKKELYNDFRRLYELDILVKTYCISKGIKIEDPLYYEVSLDAEFIQFLADADVPEVSYSVYSKEHVMEILSTLSEDAGQALNKGCEVVFWVYV